MWWIMVLLVLGDNGTDVVDIKALPALYKSEAACLNEVNVVRGRHHIKGSHRMARIDLDCIKVEGRYE